MKFRLIHAGAYTMKQHGKQYHDWEFIGLSISGRVFSRTKLPSGKIVESQGNGKPTFGMSPRGIESEFFYGENRENYVLICDIPGLRRLEEEQVQELDFNGTTIRFPWSIKVSHARCFELKERFIKAVELFNRADPASLFAAEQISRELLGELATENSVSLMQSPAEKLRKAIDEDCFFQKTLTELAVQCGYSLQHARRTFTAQFGVEPNAYRNRRRLNRIMELLAQSRYVPKEVAEAVGMKNVTHLYAFLKRECGKTPGELSRILGN